MLNRIVFAFQIMFLFFGSIAPLFPYFARNSSNLFNGTDIPSAASFPMNVSARYKITSSTPLLSKTLPQAAKAAQEVARARGLSPKREICNSIYFSKEISRYPIRQPLENGSKGEIICTFITLLLFLHLNAITNNNTEGEEENK